MLALLLQASPAVGRIDGRVTCPECRIVRTPVATLEGDMLNRPLGVAISGSHVLLTTRDGGGTILRFDRRTGRFDGAIGRKGQGPGEFDYPQDMQVIEGDSLVVYDFLLARYQVLAPGTFSFARSGPLPHGPSTLSAEMSMDRTMWIAASVVSAAQAGHTIHRYAANGLPIKSFGGGVGPVLWNDHLRLQRLLARGQAGMWSVSKYGPTTLDYWGPAGEHLRRWDYQSGMREAITAAPGGPPPDRRADIMWEAGTTRVWLLSWVPDPEWREGTVAPTGSVGSHVGARPIGDVTRFWDSRIDVIDVARGTLLARVVLDEWISHLLPGGFAPIYSEDRSGEPTLRIERLQLQSPSSPRTRRQ